MIFAHHYPLRAHRDMAKRALQAAAVLLAAMIALALLKWWAAFWCAAVSTVLAGAILHLNIAIERPYFRREEFWR